ncbi:rod shape-determining protein RodA [Oceanobacillus alkalisoli]|uniref:rod shape-determining protein RodA n=1 Tax=Oceanobacillus alkalisoli TaxID=2925113 RepID=UPI001EE474ED|nr:rod shape-determining protein RodA [Oceanobacillus alkalisoli]MCG5102190.1 rod shape-determining protein RodA [Oceanobacillus alkalisoli]
MFGEKKQLDTTILITLAGLFVFSIIAVYSGSGQYVTDNPYHFAVRQVIWYGIGISMMIGIARFDYELLKRIAPYLYFICAGLLLLVYLFGTEKNGSQRWLSFGFIEIQPSEFMKIALIIYLASVLSKIGSEKLAFKKSIMFTFRVGLVSIIPFLLIMVQPDLGSALVIIGITVSILVVSSISPKMIGLIFSIGAVFTSLLVYIFYFHQALFTRFFKPHQLSRIYGWLYPEQYTSDYGYQLQQAMLGIGSGQIGGKGVNQGVQVQSGKVPEAHTDFIFAVIGEEFGFIGSSILIFIYFLLIYRLVQIANESNDLFGSFICIGAVGLISLQVFQNIGMTIGVTPITGIALPFVSYGGSALLTNFIVIGLVLSVHLRTRKYLFADE